MKDTSERKSTKITDSFWTRPSTGLCRQLENFSRKWLR